VYDWKRKPKPPRPLFEDSDLFSEREQFRRLFAKRIVANRQKQQKEDDQTS
jgi:hypothetical protein